MVNRCCTVIMTFLLLLACCRLQAEDSIREAVHHDSGAINKGRLAATLAVQGALYLGSFAGLYFAWYKQYPQSSFHFFNDIPEWEQMDKFGHMTSSYYLSRLAYESYRWTGIADKKAALFGGIASFAYMLNIEILDGFSSGWGFSPGDFTANSIGCALFVAQQLGWREQRFNLKYSCHPTDYAKINPKLLGNNLIEQMLKDYNGMTFWLSGNISAFLPKHSRFPKWLNVAVGYGAQGMTGARYNKPLQEGSDSPEERYRQFYLSVDVDLTRIPTRSKFLKGLFTVISFVKIPAPALEVNTKGSVKFHPFYF